MFSNDMENISMFPMFKFQPQVVNLSDNMREEVQSGSYGRKTSEHLDC